MVVMERDLTVLSSLLEDFRLTEEDCNKQISDTHLEEIAHSNCSRWRSLPPHLELQKLVVEDIDHENKREEEKRNTFFFVWKKKKGSGATYRKLIGALLKIECREDAENVCKLFQKSISTQLPNSSPSVKSKLGQPDTAISEDVRLNLKQQLTINLTKIRNQYASYVSCIRESLNRKGVTAKELCAHLLYLPAFDRHIETECTLLFDVRHDLKKATTVEDIFIALSEVSSFFDCDIFQSIFKKYGLDQSQEELKYPDHLKTYIESHKVSEFMQINPLLMQFTDSSEKLVFKFDIKSTCTLADLDHLKISAAKLLGLKAAAVRLLDIKDGCVTTTYLISPSIADAIFISDKKFTAKEEEEFRAMSVMWLKYGEHFFNFRREDSHANVKDRKLDAIPGVLKVTQHHQTPIKNQKTITGFTGPVVLLQTVTNKVDIEWTDLSGKIHYTAGGHRDVLLIVSEDGLSHPDVYVQRKPAELTDMLREMLEDQGIAREDQCDDLTIVKARYSLDSERTVHGVKTSHPDGERLTKESVLRQMHTLVNRDRKSQGVVFYYIGAGRRNTGDWCFEDGFITFRDLADLYLQLLRGCVMTIVTDCSYSGCWVKECMTFLDEQGVGPCGHLARDKGILIKVYASCLSHQIPRQLTYSVYGCKNDKDTGLLSFKLQDSISLDARMASAQHVSSVDFTQVRCGQMSIEDKCLCLPQATWQAWHAVNRIYTVSGVQRGRKVFQRGRKVWHILLMADDDKTILQLLNNTQGENSGKFTINQQDYGQVLKSGSGKKPREEVVRAVKLKSLERGLLK